MQKRSFLRPYLPRRSSIRLLYVDPITGEKIVRESEIPFYKNQMRLLIGNNIKIDPKSIDDYLAVGGYSALAKALFQMTPEQVVELVKNSKPEREGRRRISRRDKVGICPQQSWQDKVCDRQRR